jgi:CHAD domain-containing protein
MSQPTPIRGLSASSPLGEAARRILAGRLADVRHPEAELTQQLSVEGVHDMRVATRRLRAALHVFEAIGPLRQVERRVAQLQDALGQVRDLHVQLDWLDEALKQEEPKHRVGLRTLRAGRQALLGQQEQRLHAELKRWEKRTVPRLLRKLDQLEEPRPYGGPRALRQLRRRLRRVDKRIERYMLTADSLCAHELRKELKKLRYELEIFQPAFRRTMSALLEMLVPLQDGLGELHDADVRLELLERIASEAVSAEREAARRLLSRVREERAQRAAEIARELQRWQSEQLTRGLRRLLH